MGAFEQHAVSEKIGYGIGYLFAYFLFTTLLYAVSLFLDKIPSSWSYLHIAVITLGITILGMITRGFLK